LPSYFINVVPADWVRPRSWIRLGPLALKSEADEPLTVEIGGQDAGREFLTSSLVLPPRTRSVVDADFYSLAYLHVKSRPRARLGVFSASRDETYLVRPAEWSNIWVYGMDIYLTGWISRSDYRQRASLIPEGSHVYQFDHTHAKNLAVPVSDLKPLSDLFERVRAWKGRE
jgi:hypothetical protein